MKKLRFNSKVNGTGLMEFNLIEIMVNSRGDSERDLEECIKNTIEWILRVFELIKCVRNGYKFDLSLENYTFFSIILCHQINFIVLNTFYCFGMKYCGKQFGRREAINATSQVIN